MSRLVAVTCSRRPLGPAGGGERVRPGRPEVFVGEAVVDALREVGLEPVLLPPGAGDGEALLAVCAGVVITGGAFDIHPRHYGAQVRGRIDGIDEGRTGLELGLARLCLARDVPVLGLCGGLQALVVAAGGTLLQHIPDAVSGALDHEQPTDPALASHAVTLTRGRLRAAYGEEVIQVNSTHHQAPGEPGALGVVGRAPDGVIEAVEHPTCRFAVGVQWHPELLDHGGRAPFRALALACR